MKRPKCLDWSDEDIRALSLLTQLDEGIIRRCVERVAQRYISELKEVNKTEAALEFAKR